MEKKVQGREDERSAFTVGVVVWGVDASWPRAYVYARTVSERPRNPNPNPKPVSAPWVNQTRPLLQRRLPPRSTHVRHSPEPGLPLSITAIHLLSSESRISYFVHSDVFQPSSTDHDDLIIEKS